MHLATWRDIAIVILSIETFVISLLPLVMLFFLNKALRSLLRALPTYAEKGQRFAKQGETLSEEISRKVASPFIWVSSAVAVVETLLAQGKRDRKGSPGEE